MDKKVSRPLLFAGEVVTIITFAISIIFYIVWAYVMLVAGALAEGLTGAAADTTEIFYIFYYMLILAIFSVIGVIISSIACARSKKIFDKAKHKSGIFIASGIYNLVFCLISAVGVYLTSFISLLFWVAIVVGAVLIFIGYKKIKLDINSSLETENMQE